MPWTRHLQGERCDSNRGRYKPRRPNDVKETMRLVVLCLIAWLVLAVAALASGGNSNGHGSRGTHSIVTR